MVLRDLIGYNESVVRWLRRPLRLFALAAVTLFGASCASLQDGAAPGTGIGPRKVPGAFLVYPVEKVRPERIIRSKSSAVVRLAGGEYEAVVLGINGPAVVSGLRVELLPTPASGDSALRLCAYRIEYVPIERASQWFARTRGRWPDPLVPLPPHAGGVPGDGKEVTEWDLEHPLNVPAGENRTLLLELFLPSGHRSDTELSVDLMTDASPAHFDIQVRPWGFDLPREPAFTTAFGFSAARVVSKHRELAPDGLDAAGIARDYLHLLARFRVSVYSPYEGAVGRIGKDGTLRFDWNGFDSVTGALLDGTFFDDVPPATSFLVPRPPKGLSAGQVDEWYRGVEAHLSERGWLDRGFAYVADEPMRSEYPEVKASATAIKAAAPGIRTLATEPFTRALAGVIDIWCPDLWALGDSISFVPIAARWPRHLYLDFQYAPPSCVYRDRAALGEQAWLYTCLSSFALDYPNLFIDTDAQSQRVIPWLAFRHGMTGLLYWQTVYAYQMAGDPWMKPYLTMTNGEGNLLYPGTPGREDITAHLPVPSLRLVLLRDGMEDYEYLALLDRAGESALAGKLARKVAPSSLTWPHNVDVLAQARVKAAERLAAAAP
jgi:hypothetical protein